MARRNSVQAEAIEAARRLSAGVICPVYLFNLPENRGDAQWKASVDRHAKYEGKNHVNLVAAFNEGVRIEIL